MTTAKQLKARVRARMARTGERYAVARAHVVGGVVDSGPVVDAGWALRGGTDPDTAALANVLAHRGVTGPDGPLTEPLLLLVGGGLGAGYILWEFAHDDSRVVTLGFTHSWQYFDRRLATTVDRLGLDVAWSRTGGAAGAAEMLTSTLVAGDPAGRVSPGIYQVVFNRDVRGCGYVATIGNVSVGGPNRGQVSVASLPTNVNGVRVRTADDAGVEADKPFHLAVTC